jgi:hypothetical protein
MSVVRNPLSAPHFVSNHAERSVYTVFGIRNTYQVGELTHGLFEISTFCLWLSNLHFRNRVLGVS